MAEASAVRLFERGPGSRILTDGEIDLRRRDPETTDAHGSAAPAWVARWAQFLELSLVFASIHEAAERLGLRTLADMHRESARLDALVETLSRLDLTRVLAENAASLAPYARFTPHADTPISGDAGLVARAVQSSLVHCPMDAIDWAAREPGVQEVAHRCRLAYDGLRAFLARQSGPRKEAIDTAGQVYADGRATIDEVAAMLGLSVPDVVALLEERGMRRTVDGLRLSPEARAERLRAVREDRVARGGQSRSVRSDVERDVIASQRIEGIDARPWLRGG